MKLVTYRHNQLESIGLLRGDSVIDLPQHCGVPDNMLHLLGSPDALDVVKEKLPYLLAHSEALPLSEVTLLPPIPGPQKIIGVGQNYPAPGQDRLAARPPYPILFERNAGSLIGSGASIYLPYSAHEVLIECELALVIGSGGKHIPLDKALESLAGYTLVNDVTARDLERRSSQWTTGKLIDRFLPAGPAIITTDEIIDIQNLRMRSWINDQCVQDGSSAEMCYTPAELITYISTTITLQPGDLIITGSPKQLGDSPAPQVFLRHGDRVRIEIEGLGVLENPVLEENND
jgi:2-keto-4-pentenoate hydratase/2-oxohepta-3-ene-1,7-dioic acid hydratase in catechol pathway